MKKYSEKRVRSLEKLGFKHEVEKLRKDYSNSNRFHEIKHYQKSKSLKNISKVALSQNSGNFLDPTKIISVSAPKWAIFEYYSARYVRGYRAHDPHELSVFSKLLVFCTINTLVAKHKIDSSRFQTIVTPTVVKFYKNSALQVDDILTLDHLIYLLLMEEGEEYELIAALNIGAYLEKKRKKEYYSVYDADEKMYKTHIAEFYELVNSYCQTMKMENIKYVEADPLRKKELNKCSASDIAMLSSECLKIPLFQDILKTPNKTIEVKFINNEGNLQVRQMQLKNKTVNNPYISYFNVARNWGENQFMSSHASVFYEAPGIEPIIVVILGSYGPNDREKDIQQIIEWYLKSITNKQHGKTDRKYLQTEGSEDPEKMGTIYKLTTNRLKTEASKQLESILQQKLKGAKEMQDFKVKTKKKSILRAPSDQQK